LKYTNQIHKISYPTLLISVNQLYFISSVFGPRAQPEIYYIFRCGFANH